MYCYLFVWSIGGVMYEWAWKETNKLLFMTGNMNVRKEPTLCAMYPLPIVIPLQTNCRRSRNMNVQKGLFYLNRQTYHLKSHHSVSLEYHEW